MISRKYDSSNDPLNLEKEGILKDSEIINNLKTILVDLNSEKISSQENQNKKTKAVS